MVRLYTMVGRMRLVSDRSVVNAAVRVDDMLVETYLGQTAHFEKRWNTPIRAGWAS
jgi:hypothetical protein